MKQTNDVTGVRKTNLGSLALISDEAPISRATAAASVSVRPHRPADAQISVRPVAVRPIRPATIRPADVNMPVSVLRINDVRFLNPDFSKALASIQFLAAGVPRNQIAIPVCNSTEVSDQILFEEAIDATKKLYLPRYRIATQNISGQPQYRVSLEGSGDGGILTLYLEKYPAEQLGIAVREAKELPHEVTVILKYVLANSGGIQKELIFQEVMQEDDLLRSVLHVDSLPEKDELFYALTDREYRTELIVRRTAKVAVPVDSQPAAIDLIELAADSESRWMGGRLIDADNIVDNVDLPWLGSPVDSQGFVRFDDNVSMEGGSIHSRVLRTHPKWVDQGTITGWLAWRTIPTGARFQADVGFLNGAVHTDGVTFWVFVGFRGFVAQQGPVIQHFKQYTGNLDHIEMDLSAYAGQPFSIALRVDSGASSGQDWAAWVNPVIIGEPLFRETTRVLDNSIPQYFDLNLHRYIFTDLPAATGPKPGMKQ